MLTIQQRLATSLAGCTIKEWHTLAPRPALFEADPMAVKLFDFMSSFVREHGKSPSLTTLNEKFGLQLKPEEAEREFLLSRAQETRVKRRLAIVTSDLQALMQSDPVQALKVLHEECGGLISEMSQTKVYDFKQAIEQAWPWLVAKWTGQIPSVPILWPTLQAQMGGVQGGEVFSVIGRPGMGKAQPLTSLVLMADGQWQKMGQLKIGDRLASVDGAESRVEAIYPQGVRPVYEIEMADGRVVKADAEHLWEVHSSKWDAPRNLTTLEIEKTLTRTRYEGRLGLPAVSGVFGKACERPDPYILGMLVGDGCFRSNDMRLTCADAETIQRVHDRLPAGYGITSNGIEHRITCGVHPGPKTANVFKQWFQKVGLWGELSLHKFIPHEVFGWPREDRLDFLQGLFDSDGWSSGGATVFGSSSLNLAKSVQNLCWSLGMSASLSAGSNRSWRVVLLRDNGICPFKLSRKGARHLEIEKQQRQDVVKIIAVRRVEDEECQCIRVSHPRHLYVTDGYVVTHNTWLMLSLAMHIWEQLNRPVIFVSMEIMRRNLMTRAASLYSGVAADWFKHGDTPTLYGQDKKKKVHQLLAQLQKSDKASFYVVDGNLTASTTDVVELCRAHEPCAVFVDGAYMLKVPSNRGLKGHEKIEEITSVLKRDVATGMDIPVFTSWQFNREATKVKKDQTPSLEHIAGGDYIGFISSVVVGLLDAPEEVAGNAKHAGRRRLQILKGRDGETGEMLLNWDFAGMDFREIDPDSNEAKTVYGIDEVELEDAA